MRNASILFLAILFLSIPTIAGSSEFGQYASGGDFTPEPRLISPTTEKVDLCGKKELEFKWSPFEGKRGMRQYYDFRLYKGYDMVASSLLFKEKVDPGTYQTSVKTDMFENGQVYTWSVRQVYDGAHKSNRSTASFTIIKK